MKTMINRRAWMEGQILFVSSLLILFAGGCAQDRRWNDMGGGPEQGSQGQHADSGTPETSTDSGPGGSKASFSLPQGWKINDEGGDINAVLNLAPPDSYAPYILLQFTTAGKGGNQEAQTAASSFYEEQEKMNGQDQVSFSAINIGDLPAWLVEEHTSSAWGGKIWTSTVFFSKDGFVSSASLWDKYENQRDVFATLVSTLKRK